MPEHTGPTDSLKAEKIYCVFERGGNPSRLSTQGRHNAQQMTIDGNPATATIKKILRFLEKE
jgi:hypothetical protein